MTKSFCSLLITAFLGSGVAFTSPQKPPSEIVSLRQRLALTADQQAQFRGILRERKAALEEIRHDATLPLRVRREKIKAVHAESNTKMRALLNENQLTEFDQILRERRERSEARRQTTVPLQ